MIRILGIDPGVKTAVAILEDGQLAFWTVSFWGAYHLIRGTWQPLDINVIVVEVATDTYVWQKSARNRASVAKAMRVAQDVGAVRREGQLLAEGLRDLFCVVTRPPQGKLNAERFGLLTGYEGRTNQHERDAGLLAWTEYQSIKQRARLSA